MRAERRRWRTAAAAGVLAAIAVLGTAASASAMALPPNPPVCHADLVQLPCTPRVLAPYFLGTASYSVPLSAATQNATGIPGDPGATGTSSISFDLTNNKVCATTSWSGVDSPVVAAHIHGGRYGQPENPAITINLFAADFANGKPSPQSGCATVPAPELAVIKKCPREFNVVVHSKNHPVGALRGQLGTTCSV
jgi:hypothetical protein